MKAIIYFSTIFILIIGFVIETNPLLFFDVRIVGAFIIPLIGFSLFAFDFNDIKNSFKYSFKSTNDKKALLIGINIFSFMKNISIGISILTFIFTTTFMFWEYLEPYTVDINGFIVKSGLSLRPLIYGLSFAYLIFEPMKMSLKGQLTKLD